MQLMPAKPKSRPAFVPTVVAVIFLFGAIGAVGAYVLTRPASVSPPPTAGPRNCAPTAMLVNPCRPWFGAAAGGNPGAPTSRIAQFNYAERLIGRRLDIFRDYHSPPGAGPNGDLPLNSAEIALARRPNTYIDVNWKPAVNWAAADGGNPAVNRNIARAAASIKTIAPHKIFLTLWWEPQHYVSSDPGHYGCRLSGTGNAGTPAQYVAMWQNVERIFRAEGVTNVIWAMDYQAPAHGLFDCLVPQLWPGNNLVDWVLYDTYSRNAQGSWANTVGPFYDLLLHDSSPRVNFDSKPWGLGEFGTCSNGDNIVAQNFYLEAKAALKANTFPRLKMYLAFDDASGPKAGPGCLSNYNESGQPDSVKQAYFNQFANAVLTDRK
jgi:hypothetical protein